MAKIVRITNRYVFSLLATIVQVSQILDLLPTASVRVKMKMRDARLLTWHLVHRGHSGATTNKMNSKQFSNTFVLFVYLELTYV